VRTVVELVQNEHQYTNRFAHSIGTFDEAIRNISRNFSFSELHEIGALSNVLKCKIRSIYPRIQYHSGLDVINNTFDVTQSDSLIATIYIFWTHTRSEIQARRNNAGNWSPNHFVPLLLPSTKSRPQADLSLLNIYPHVSLLLFIIAAHN
jgi:hypothetical protein